MSKIISDLQKKKLVFGLEGEEQLLNGMNVSGFMYKNHAVEEIKSLVLFLTDYLIVNVKCT